MTGTRAPAEPTSTAPAHGGHGRPGAMPSTLGLVVSREVRVRGRSKGFILSTLGMLVLLVGVIVVPTLLGGGPTVHRVGVVGEGNAAIVAGAERLADSDPSAEARTTIEVTGYPDVAAAERAVTGGEVDAALVDGSRVVVARTGGFGSSALVDLLQDAAGAERIRQLVGDAAAGRVDAVLTGQTLDVTAASGEDAAQTDGRTWLAYGGVFLTYILIVQYGTWTLSGVTEEKSNRVIEVLLATARPWQLFAGKVIGVGVLGLGQFALTLVVTLTAIRVTGAFDLPVLPVAFAAVLTLWVLVGFAMYLVLFGSAGALAAKMEDAQSAMSPIMTVILVGFFASMAVLANPDGTVAVAGTFVPLVAPFVVPIRAALDAIPLWQHVLAVLLSLLAIGGLTALSGRVYRGGALRFAGRVGWRQAFRRPE